LIDYEININIYTFVVTNVVSTIVFVWLMKLIM